ncbi:MAG: hypothetical protein J6M66_08060 [Lachnospiraceae bacterium]|nr:hypothetical protein [Lachnospiraceae bacterium]
MLRREKYELVSTMKAEIDRYLKNTDLQGIRRMQLFLANSEMFPKLRQADNQLYMLDRFCYIWRREKAKLLERGMDEDIFWQVHSLEELQRKYNVIKYAILRIENHFPQELSARALDEVIRYRISGTGIGVVIDQESFQKRNNMIQIAGLLEKRDQQGTAVMLLEYGLDRGILT